MQVTPDDRAVDDGALLSIVYLSTATTPFSELDLALLLSSSRLSNQVRGLTGMLLHRGGRFLQALEGPEATVRRVYDVIAADPRHTDLRAIDEQAITERAFGSWAMGYRTLSDDDAPEWFGSPEAADVHGDSRATELLARFRAL